MGEKLTCVSVATELLDQAKDEFAPAWVENETYRRGFLVLCGAIDTIIEDNDASEFHVVIDEEELTIRISVTAPTIQGIKCMYPLLYEVLKVSVGFTCERRKDCEEVELSMVFPPIWEKAWR